MITIRNLTPAERAVIGQCPVCHAQPGEVCIPVTVRDLEVAGQFAHVARLVSAPKTIAAEENNDQ